MKEFIVFIVINIVITKIFIYQLKKTEDGRLFIYALINSISELFPVIVGVGGGIITYVILNWLF